ncbi:hypothetical protein LWI29_011598 [Acer saccharum]|uniref:Separase-like TPR repeats region domain-containing protein n=1 Tax=Acer saccharum TaxID=4024 RepID=A0AA39VFW7_ACESA|nr:hypothetical protein LWI29_011598 [Acer saccharum]
MFGLQDKCGESISEKRMREKATYGEDAAVEISLAPRSSTNLLGWDEIDVLRCVGRRLSSQPLTNDATGEQNKLTKDLFDLYRLCLGYLDLLSPYLSGKPYMFLESKVKLVSLLASFKIYNEAESEGFKVSDKLRLSDFDGKYFDPVFARVFPEVVKQMVKFAMLWHRKEDEVYWRVLDLIKEAIKSIDLIVKLYAIGLYIRNYDVQHRGDDLTSSKGAEDEIVRMLLDDCGRLHNLAGLLASLSTFFNVCCKEKRVSSTVEIRGSYLDALQFLSKQLAKLVKMGTKKIIAEAEATSCLSQLSTIQDAFDQYYDVFVSLPRQVNLKIFYVIIVES